jgi:hypothetical protein
MMGDSTVSELDRFRWEVSHALALGRLSEVELPVVDIRGQSPVVVALGEERLAVLLRRVQAVGGYANVFVRRESGTSLVAFLDASGALDPQSAEDMSGSERPSADATVDLFVEYLLARPQGILLPRSLSPEPVPQIVRAQQDPVPTR